MANFWTQEEMDMPFYDYVKKIQTENAQNYVDNINKSNENDKNNTPSSIIANNSQIVDDNSSNVDQQPQTNTATSTTSNEKSDTPLNRATLSEDQYNWSVKQGNKIDLGDGKYGDLRNALNRPDNPIKDVFNDEGVRIGAYNTETGWRYGLQNTIKDSTGTEPIVKDQQSIADSQSPDSDVNQTVNSVMNNSLLTNPATTITSPSLAQDNDPKRGRYISPATVNALNDMNPDAPDLTFAEQFADGYKNLWNKIRNEPYQPDPYIPPNPAYISQKDINEMNKQQGEAYPAWLTSNNPLNFNK